MPERAWFHDVDERDSDSVYTALARVARRQGNLDGNDVEIELLSDMLSLALTYIAPADRVALMYAVGNLASPYALLGDTEAAD